jgi:hypothetical protein
MKQSKEDVYNETQVIQVNINKIYDRRNKANNFSDRRQHTKMGLKE